MLYDVVQIFTEYQRDKSNEAPESEEGAALLFARQASKALHLQMISWRLLDLNYMFPVTCMILYLHPPTIVVAFLPTPSIFLYTNTSMYPL